jgi:hypothetical protein
MALAIIKLMARPKKEILPVTQFEKIGKPANYIERKIFEELCEIQCTRLEIESVLHVDRVTLDKWMMKTYGKQWTEVFATYSNGGKMSMKRELFNLARTPGKSQLGALIWYGKQYMQQSDRIESRVNQTNINENPQISSLVQAALELMNGKVGLNEAATKTVSAATGSNVYTGPGAVGQVDVTTKIQGEPV